MKPGLLNSLSGWRSVPVWFIVSSQQLVVMSEQIKDTFMIRADTSPSCLRSYHRRQTDIQHAEHLELLDDSTFNLEPMRSKTRGNRETGSLALVPLSFTAISTGSKRAKPFAVRWGLAICNDS